MDIKKRNKELKKQLIKEFGVDNVEFIYKRKMGIGWCYICIKINQKCGREKAAIKVHEIRKGLKGYNEFHLIKEQIIVSILKKRRNDKNCFIMR